VAVRDVPVRVRRTGSDGGRASSGTPGAGMGVDRAVDRATGMGLFRGGVGVA